MPTPAKLVSAILFAALAWCVGEAIVRYCLEEGVQVGRFREILAAGGLVLGWRMIGRPTTGQTGRGAPLAHGVTAGIAAAAAFLVLGLLFHSLGTMLQEAMNGGTYTSIGRAGSAWMIFLVRDFKTVADPIVLGLLFGGGALVGLIAGITGQRMR